jgi:4'-phosphopantetheinyl transferase
MIWLPPPAEITLSDSIVHIWRSHLDIQYSQFQKYYAFLNDTERKRADRYRFDKSRHRFIVTRGILRLLLSQYCSKPAEEIEFQYNDWGKPYLTGDKEIRFMFNIAHSNNLAVFAFTHTGNIGIDVEYNHPIKDMDQMVVNFFSKFEQATYETLPQSRRLKAFFTCWVRKEAYIKARGKGLSIPLNSFDVAVETDAINLLLRDQTDETATKKWIIYDVNVGEGYSAALAVERNSDTHKLMYYECETTI